VSVRARNLPEQATASRQRNLYILGGIVAVVLVAFVVIILITNRSSANLERYAGIPQSRTADGAFVLGNPDAPITLIEFADFTCSVCQTQKPTTDQFIEQFVATGKAKFEHRTLMTAGGPVTGYAAQLAECAEAQRPGAFWEAYEVLYEFGSRGAATYNNDMARPFAERLNLNLAQLLNCVGSARQIDKDQAFAQRYGISATPNFLIRYGDNNIQPYNGGRDIEDFAVLVEAAQQ
jgi:protein-disulfide isomerase